MSIFDIMFLIPIIVFIFFLGQHIIKQQKVYDGVVKITQTSEGKKLFSLEVESDLDNLDKKKHIRLKVVSQIEMFSDER